MTTLAYFKVGYSNKQGSSLWLLMWQYEHGSQYLGSISGAIDWWRCPIDKAQTKATEEALLELGILRHVSLSLSLSFLLPGDGVSTSPPPRQGAWFGPPQVFWESVECRKIQGRGRRVGDYHPFCTVHHDQNSARIT